VDLVRLVFWSFGASVGGWRLAVSTLGALEVSECSFGVLVAGWIAASIGGWRWRAFEVVCVCFVISFV